MVEIRSSTPAVDALADVVAALAAWQRDGPMVPLHPGDLGWHWRFGAEATAAAVRIWTVDAAVEAIGLLDGADLRLGIAPEAHDDEALASRMLDDLVTADRGVLPAGSSVELRVEGPLRRGLLDRGWAPGQAWTSLRRDLTAPVEDPGLAIEVVDARRCAVRAAVQRAAFDGSTFTPERWRSMASGPAYASARCLLALDEGRTAVAAATVWSAGPGRPGLIEPLGVHHEHRGRGFGTAVTLAAARALRELGASSSTVSTPSSNVAAVAAYESAGLERLVEVCDLHRR